MGDTSAFWTTLNAVAMFFSQTGFIYSAGLAASMVTLAMVAMSLLAIAANDKSGQNPYLAFIYLGITFIFTSITVNTQVEDIYSGNVVQVNNIPAIVAAPASLITTASYKIFTTIDTAYQGVGGSYMSVSANGMKTPLQLLYAMKSGWAETTNVESVNYRLLLANCSPNNPNFSTSLQNATDILGFLTANLNQIGTTLYFPNPSPGQAVGNLSTMAPQYMSCKAATTAFVNEFNNLYSNAVSAGVAGMTIGQGSGQLGFNSVLSQNMSRNKVQTNQLWTLNNVQATLGSILQSSSPSLATAAASLTAGGQWIQNTLTTQILADATVSGIECMNENLPSLAAACWSRVSAERTAKEQWKADAAGGGSLFASMMGQTVTFMQIMFFAFSPIILIFALFLGAGSIKLIGKYLMFCVWSVSWWPFAAVIQNYIQTQVADQLVYLASSGGGINVNTMNAYYDIISSNLGIASNALAAVPIFSMALLTGSHQAMSSLATSMGGGDHFDEKNAVGSGQQVGAIASQAPMRQGDTMGSMKSGASQASLNTSLGGASSIESAQSMALSASQSQAEAIAAADGVVKTATRSDAQSQAWGRDVSETIAHGKSIDENAVKELSQSLGISQAKASEVYASVKAGATMGAAIAGSKAEIGAETGTKMSASEKMDRANQASEKISQAVKESNSVGDQVAQKMSTGISSGYVETNGSTDSVTHQLTNANTQAKEARNALSNAQSLNNSAAFARNASETELASQLQQHALNPTIRAASEHYAALKTGAAQEPQEVMSELRSIQAAHNNSGLQFGANQDGGNTMMLAQAISRREHLLVMPQ